MVVYFLMALLTLLLGVIALRYVLFGAVWIMTGHSFWVFPNLMSDQARRARRASLALLSRAAGIRVFQQSLPELRNTPYVHTARAQVGILDAFSPFVSYERPKKGSRTQILARLFTLFLAAGTVYMLYTHAPDADKLAENAKEVCAWGGG